MPRYSFKCSKCGMRFDHTVPSVHRNSAQVCPGCDGPASRNVADEYTNMGNVDAPCKENTRYSHSMGVNPSQINDAERNFPGSKYVRSGPKAGCLIINSRQHKIQEMKRRGMEELR